MSVGRIGGTDKISRDTASSGLEALDKQAKAETEGPQRNAKVDEVAKLYEKQFLREMVKAMRSTVNYGTIKPSMAENIYRDELDSQYVESWGEKGGVGLADLIYEQIMARYFNSPVGQAVKGKGEAIPLTDRDISRVHRVKTDVGGQVPLRIEIGSGGVGGATKVRAPWDAEVVSNLRLEGGKTALTLQHEPRFRSTLVFEGVAGVGLEPGSRIEQGRVVGILSPETRSFLWNLNAVDTIAPVETSRRD